MSAQFKRLEDGRTIHFRYFYLGRGLYDVFAAGSGGADVYLGQIRTTAPVARAVDRNAWLAVPKPPEVKFDSMNDAAEALLRAIPVKPRLEMVA